MTEQSDLDPRAGPGRRLLVELVVRGDEDQPALLERVIGSLQEVRLDEAHIKRIRETLHHVLASAQPGKEGARQRASLRLRAWLLARGSPEQGWGFFLVDRGAGHERAAPTVERLVELFLY
jgi:hypothetical protein